MAQEDIYTEFIYDFLFLLAASFPLGCYIGYCCSGERRASEEEPNVAALAQWVVAVELASMSAPVALVVNMKLGYFPYSAAVPSMAASGERPMCVICLEAFVHGTTCSEVPACRHFFHQACIELWMRSKSTCPLFRATIVPGSEPLSAAEDMV